jgi:hypothetical protein
LHRRIGGVYLVAMVGIMLTALPLAGAAFAARHPVTGTFLLYLILITGTAIWTAWRAIEDRSSFARFMGVWFQPLAWANVLAGACILTTGITVGAPVLIGLAPIGLLVGGRMLKLARNPPTDRGWWLQRHYTATIASGAATHIAFLNIGMQHLVPPAYSRVANYVAWFAPVIAAGLALIWAHRRYGSRSSTRDTTLPSTSRT